MSVIQTSALFLFIVIRFICKIVNEKNHNNIRPIERLGWRCVRGSYALPSWPETDETRL